MIAETDRRAVAEPEESRDDLLEQVWREHLPSTELELAQENLAFFTFRVNDERPRDGEPPADLVTLLEESWILAEPIVYEDFLPRWAAGIFSSTLTGQGRVDLSEGGAPRDRAWLSGAVDRPIADAAELYAAQREDSLTKAQQQLGLDHINLPQPALPTAPYAAWPFSGWGGGTAPRPSFGGRIVEAW